MKIDQEFETLMAEVCQSNAKLPKKDRIIVDFDTGHVGKSTVTVTPTTGRNDPCPCGSGKKFKKCCIN